MSTARKLAPTAITTAVLAAIWVALWQSLSAANVLGGIAVAVGIQLLAPDMRGTAVGRVALRPVAGLRFLGHFTVELVKAALVVGWEVMTPRNHDAPAMLAVDLRSSSPTIVTAVANAVTLTPGTVTVEATTSPPRLVMHVLHAQDPEAIRRGVRRLEDLAIAAFRPRRDGEALQERPGDAPGAERQLAEDRPDRGPTDPHPPDDHHTEVPR